MSSERAKGVRPPTRRAGPARTARATPSRRKSPTVARRFPALVGRLPTLSSAAQRDLAVLALMLVALFSALALLVPDALPLRFWRDSLLSLFGRGAPLAPAFLLVLAIGHVPGLERLRPGWRRLVGVGLVGVGLLGVLHLSVSDPLAAAMIGDGGGYLGLAITDLLGRMLGRLGAWLVLALLVLAGFMLVAGLTVPTVGRALLRVGLLLAAVGQAGLRLGRAAGRWLAERRALSQEPPDGLPVASPVPLTDAVNRRRQRTAAATVEPDETAAEEEHEPRLILPRTDGRRGQPVSSATPPTGPTRIAGGELLWSLPSIELLDSFPDVEPDPADAQQKARIIDQTLTSFKVDARVREIYAGPSFTQFAVEPGVGVKVRRITELQNDLALALAVSSLRIEAPVPGKARVGIEIPNATTAVVGLRETLESEEWNAGRAKLKLPLVLGRDVSGKAVVVDMARMPHLLIAGATGSGKSVCLNAIIACLLLQATPDTLRLVMIDPKRVELSSYAGVPHLQTPVVTDMNKVVGVLRKIVAEMERRYELLQSLGVRNLDGYLARCQQDTRLERMPYLLLIVDELADLMMTAPEEVEGLLCRLAQMGRATGIHLILATQRPSVDVVTGLIKANFPSRIAFAVSSQIDSRVILDTPGAERLMGRGDMLYQASDAPKPQRIQGVYLYEPNIEEIVRHWRKHVEAPSFDPEWVNIPDASAESSEMAEDDLFEEASTLVRQQGTASTSMLQRRLRIGYNRAARLVERLEERGIIGPASAGRRPVLETGVEPAVVGSERDDEDLPL